MQPEDDLEPVREAVAFAVVAMILADGRAEPVELEHARSGLARCRLFAANELEDDRAMLARAEAAVQSDLQAAMARHAPVLGQSPWRYAALAIMADIMASDDVVAPAEVAVIEEVARAFGIEAAEVSAVVAHVGTDALEDLITGENLDAIHGMPQTNH